MDAGKNECMRGGMQERRDEGKVGFRTGGIHESRDSGLEGYGKEVIQEKEGKKMRVQGVCGTG